MCLPPSIIKLKLKFKHRPYSRNKPKNELKQNKIGVFVNSKNEKKEKDKNSRKKHVNSR